MALMIAPPIDEDRRIGLQRRLRAQASAVGSNLWRAYETAKLLEALGWFAGLDAAGRRQVYDQWLDGADPDAAEQGWLEFEGRGR